MQVFGKAARKHYFTWKRVSIFFFFCFLFLLLFCFVLYNKTTRGGNERERERGDPPCAIREDREGKKTHLVHCEWKEENLDCCHTSTQRKHDPSSALDRERISALKQTCTGSIPNYFIDCLQPIAYHGLWVVLYQTCTHVAGRALFLWVEGFGRLGAICSCSACPLFPTLPCGSTGLWAFLGLMAFVRNSRKEPTPSWQLVVWLSVADKRLSCESLTLQL